ncbi:MAG: dienelactone hydrolase [Planctomycetota bacterium]
MIRILVALAAPFAQDPAPPAPLAYDPLRRPAPASASELPASLALVVHDAKRQRDVPVRVYLPASATPAPVVLFSHGLGGSRDNNPYLGEHWSARGYVVVYLQHAGSDENVWRNRPLGRRMDAMRQAASAENLALRCNDVKATLDQLTTWNDTGDHELHGRLDLEHVGMCGHSFGAVTTQATTGQALPLLGQRFTDPRIDAALPMSPSRPRAGSAERAFAGVRVPWLLMTGTRDEAPIGGQTSATRLEVFPALPSTIDHYELVLDGAQHSAFGQRALPGDAATRNPNHHRAILALSTAFWDTYLRGDSAARAWLQGTGPNRILETDDRWQVSVVR